MKNELRPFISAKIAEFVPENIRINNPQFVKFLEAYLEYLETEHKSAYFANNVAEQRDIELQEDQFLRKIEKEIGLFVPKRYESEPRVFYRKVSELWRSKGSIDGIKTFFQLFLNAPVQVRLPWDLVLKPSDGRRTVDTILRISPISGDPEMYRGRTIYQKEFFAAASVIDVRKVVYANEIVYELVLNRNSLAGTFSPGNNITLIDESAEAEIYRSLSALNVVNRGSGYAISDEITFNRLPGVSFVAYVDNVDEDGGILSAVIGDFGSGNTPNHVRAVQGSGRYFFEDFFIFEYSQTDSFGNELSLERKSTIFENTTVDEGFVAWTQDYTDPEEFYFAEDYVGEIQLNADDQSTTEPGFDFAQDVIGFSNLDPIPLEIAIRTENGQGADFSFEFDAVVRRSGFYTGIEGQLSTAIVLQDSKFYQKFSYEVVSENDIADWIDPLKIDISPAGVIPFNRALIPGEVNTELTITDEVIVTDIEE